MHIRQKYRSGTQQCPICGNQVPLVEHHISGRDIPNFDQPFNICWICSTCHDLVHISSNKDSIVIEGYFNTTEGRKLIFHYKNEPSLTNQDKITYIFSNKK